MAIHRGMFSSIYRYNAFKHLAFKDPGQYLNDKAFKRDPKLSGLVDTEKILIEDIKQNLRWYGTMQSDKATAYKTENAKYIIMIDPKDNSRAIIMVKTMETTNYYKILVPVSVVSQIGRAFLSKPENLDKKVDMLGTMDAI